MTIRRRWNDLAKPITMPPDSPSFTGRPALGLASAKPELRSGAAGLRSGSAPSLGRRPLDPAPRESGRAIPSHSEGRASRKVPRACPWGSTESRQGGAIPWRRGAGAEPSTRSFRPRSGSWWASEASRTTNPRPSVRHIR